ncbi:hypothetical protein J3458_000955 [Metarhizium acridum]|uniref:uncharacterized protein n=1 Tax=Metarhizium acridum TaxID=92637 RepID=UPI001C6BA736|nr:hypothetical protein J3458_000955 [Metarhizium acridum]
MERSGPFATEIHSPGSGEVGRVCQLLSCGVQPSPGWQRVIDGGTDTSGGDQCLEPGFVGHSHDSVCQRGSESHIAVAVRRHGEKGCIPHQMRQNERSHNAHLARTSQSKPPPLIRPQGCKAMVEVALANSVAERATKRMGLLHASHDSWVPVAVDGSSR